VISFAVFQRNNAQDLIFHIWNTRPTANSSIGLYFLTQWIFDHALDSFIQNHGAVGALTRIG
jgi:hypothetical protein